MPDFSRRSTQIEIMDDLNSSGPIIAQTLRELEFINTWLGGNAVTINSLNKLKRQIRLPDPLQIIDLGCGGGDMLKLVDQWAKQNRINVNLLGVDANPNITSFAREHVKLPNVSFRNLDIFSEEFLSVRCDIAIATLFFHHFSQEQLIAFFKKIQRQVTKAVVINDIHRHPLAYYSIKWLTQAFSKSQMVINDAPVSVLRAFSREEIEKICKESGFSSYSIEWKWAFRWQVILYQ